ncbi:unnamed protein product [Mytilus coruscus]|uniref:Reverse transcriptase domain-containing protein n=1 Tax=Mytilus coruscus TaxID=42192 RepID=A0A6J8AB61_MYTCO|nr:unnamed protein product [Mytilus coruscus]
MKMMAVQKDNNGHSINDFNAKSSHSQGRDNNLLINDIFSWKDPQIFLKSASFDPNVNYFDITDFLLNSLGDLTESDEKLVSEASGGKLVFKSGPAKPKLETLTAHQQILTEIENGNYIFVNTPPKIISPLGVIPKPDGGVRIIHDCSRPMGSAVNDFAGEFDKQRFQTVDDACKLVSKNFYMAKVDLKAAYRSVRISKQTQKVTGLKWAFPDGHEYTFIDKKLPFWSKLAPGIFHSLSQAVRRMMSRRGFTIVAYLDDFFIARGQKSIVLRH